MPSGELVGTTLKFTGREVTDGHSHFSNKEENAMDSELGDMGDSNDKGVEADIHNEVVSLREVLESSNEPIGDDADNIDDLKGE